MTETKKSTEGFSIFRASEAAGLMASKCMTVEPFSDIQRAGMNDMLAAGFTDGEEVRVLCNIPGFSLVYVWFKKNYPLPLHSHDSDCLYYIIAGALRLGTEDLGPRDSFFLPAGVPYTYKSGEDGVELLEFRTEQHFNFVNLSKGEGFWKKATETIVANRADWIAAVRPTQKATEPA